MIRLTQLIFYFLFYFLCSPCQSQGQLASISQENQRLSEFIGRYRMSDESVLLVGAEDGHLTARPILWRATQFLRSGARDTFVVDDRADRQLIFLRDSNKRITSARFSGIGDTSTFLRLDEKPAPIELLFQGRPREAFAAMIHARPRDTAMLVRIGKSFLRSFPSRANDAVRFLKEISDNFPKTPEVHSALADAYIAVGQRAAALKSYEDAYGWDPTNASAVAGLRRLNALPMNYPSADGWLLPFPLDSLFVKPTAAEILSVEINWAERDLSSPNPIIVARYRLNLGHTAAEARIIEYKVHGSRCYGAIIVPDGVPVGHSPIILELRGVAWNYPPLNLETDLLAPRFLDSDQDKVIYVVPSFRGETIQINGTQYTSAGDRTDAFDGATDDALALLAVAFRLTPEADTTRVCAFGKSRGGSVALLAGIRDSRISGILDWAGPTDWFEMMGTGGWTQKELVADGLIMRATPREPGGQFIERFLKKSIEGSRRLNEVRLHLLASSPLYFMRRPRRFEAHYGIEDDMVPLRNGEALRSALNNNGTQTFRFFFHETVGHDLNRTIAFRESRAFVLDLLHAQN